MDRLELANEIERQIEEAAQMGEPPSFALQRHDADMLVQILRTGTQGFSAYVPSLSNEGPVLNAALNTWFASEQGVTCMDGITTGKYLKNRLEAAFIAGWDARTCESQP